MPSEWSDSAFLQKHPELKEKAEALSKQIDEAMNKLKNDKEMNVIFARQDYEIKTGGELGLDPSLEYLYLDFPDEQWELAEKKLKAAAKTMKRLSSEEEQKALEAISEEREKSDQGLGFIFG
ncbi:MAG: hypothetical protein ACP5T4_03905 [Candidatus Micrarchaeia archaeon]